MWSDGKFSSHSMDSIAFVSVPSAVDLGLSVMWANMDLNAGKDTESGAFYSWGEITPKAEYTEENYKFGKAGSMTKYNESDSEIGVSRILDPEDDAATQVLGGKWRMPTIEEWQELITKCKWTWKTRFWIVTGPSGKSIRIMASNYDQDNDPDGRKATSIFWSSSFDEISSTFQYARVFYFSGATRKKSISTRHNGHNIRPVHPY